MGGNKLFIIYDGRAILGDTDDAAVMETCKSLKEARRNAKTYGECAIYEYDIGPGNELINESFVEATKP